MQRLNQREDFSIANLLLKEANKSCKTWSIILLQDGMQEHQYFYHTSRIMGCTCNVLLDMNAYMQFWKVKAHSGKLNIPSQAREPHRPSF
eukprot:scaffold83_cov390-Pavlova_lutheri.AAC.7